MKVIELKIKGMTCAGCSTTVARSLDELKGIEERNIDHESDSGIVTYDKKLLTEQEIIAKINETHYKVEGFEHLKNSVSGEPCPKCGKAGQKVPNTVFKSMLDKELRGNIHNDKDHYLCMNPGCKTAYFGTEIEIYTSLLRKPLWFKNEATRKIICYCNNIDREQIKEAVKHHGLTSWEEITAFYRPKVIEKCEVFNPTGLCCRETFAKTVEEIIH